MKIKHVKVDVYVSKSLPDCTNGGLTSKIETAELFCDCGKEDAAAWCAENGKDPSKQLILVRRKLFGGNADYAEPLMKEDGRWGMHGGNFIYTCDGRFREYTGSRLPLPVHDRFENER